MLSSEEYESRNHISPSQGTHTFPSRAIPATAENSLCLRLGSSRLKTAWKSLVVCTLSCPSRSDSAAGRRGEIPTVHKILNRESVPKRVGGLGTQAPTFSAGTFLQPRQ